MEINIKLTEEDLQKDEVARFISYLGITENTKPSKAKAKLVKNQTKDINEDEHNPEKNEPIKAVKDTISDDLQAEKEKLKEKFQVLTSSDRGKAKEILTAKGVARFTQLLDNLKTKEDVTALALTLDSALSEVGSND